MILEMRRVTVVGLRRERDVLLADLQDIGAVELGAASGDDRPDALAAARDAAAAVPRALAGLRDAAGAAPAGEPDAAVAVAPDADSGALLDRVLALLERREAGAARAAALRSALVAVGPLGDFDPAALRRLLGSGVDVRVLRGSPRMRPEAPQGTFLREVARDRRHRYLAWVGAPSALEAGPVPEGLEPVPLPGSPPAALRDELAELERDLLRDREALASLAHDPAALRALRGLGAERADLVRFLEARAALRAEGVLAVLRGYAPVRDVPRLRAAADRRGWALLVEPVDDPAAAPTAIETPRWVRPVQAVFSLVGVVPGYGQADVSAPFLVFFSLFFAMIVGDAGYGLVFLLLTELARRTLHPPRHVVTLLRLLSVSTIVWGALSGTFFGLEPLPHPLTHLRLDWLVQPDNVMLLSFLIGAVHLSLAHLWNALRALPSTRALAQLGWVLVTWTMFFLARTLVLGTTFPRAMPWVVGVGVALIIVFMTPPRELRAAWFQHAMLPLNLVSAFVDVVSYVRLFAVGAASFAVASAFDQMALGTGLSGPLAGLAAALILFLGHTLNILLATMGVLVHGVRLNTLEFAGHLGLEWSGHPYRPFRHETPEVERA